MSITIDPTPDPNMGPLFQQDVTSRLDLTPDGRLAYVVSGSVDYPGAGPRACPVPVPTGFRRVSQELAVSDDRRRLAFRLVDVETPPRPCHVPDTDTTEEPST